MHISIQLVQLICTASLFDMIACDNLSLASSRDDAVLNNEVGCTAACMERNQTATLYDCYDHCKRTSKKIDLHEIDGSETIRLRCREDDSLTIEMNTNMIQIVDHSEQRQYQGSIFLFKLQENVNPQREIYISDSPILQVKDLHENTVYNVTASVFHGNSTYHHLLDMASFKTLTSGYTPKQISNETINLKFIPQSGSEKPLVAIINLQPTEDLSCYYQYSLSQTNNSVFDFESVNPKLLKLNEIYEIRKEVPYGTNYTFEIFGSNTKDDTIEGTHFIYNFTTPTCYAIYNNDMEMCPPYPLVNISSMPKLIGSNLYQINVTWNSPIDPPSHYNVTLNLETMGVHTSQFINGTINFAFFPEVKIFDPGYDVTITAFSPGGETTNKKDFELYKNSFFGEYILTSILLAVLIPILTLLCGSFIFIVVRYRRNRLRHKKEIDSKEMELQKLIQSHSKDEMEIETTNVELYETLGEGAFGIVRRGFLKTANKAIAVKMLKKDACIEDIKGFLDEIALMKSVGHHENIVGIVGHCTQLHNMMLLTEYCCEGNLLDHLRKFREKFSPDFYSTAPTNVISLSSFEKSPENIFNFDSKLVDKFMLKDKSLSLSIIDSKTQPKLLGETNIISNRLYDEQKVNDSTYEKERSSNISYENETTIKSKLNECNGINGSELIHNRKCAEKPKNLDRIIETGTILFDSEVLLFADNQAYELVLSSENSVDSKPYEMASVDMKSTKIDQKRMSGEISFLTGKDLLMFAKQIANGMEFLANNKIVHRDLAARNVLVCADKKVKIADFGLSRDIYVDNIYMKSSAGRLPIKWLALESMTERKYTSQSDVWSYGILLYEIVTLGRTPYPTVPVDCVLDYLKSGNRMSKPHNCSQQIYDLMLNCWHCEPNDRPTFTEISRKIEWFIRQLDANEFC